MAQRLALQASSKGLAGLHILELLRTTAANAERRFDCYPIHFVLLRTPTFLNVEMTGTLQQAAHLHPKVRSGQLASTVHSQKLQVRALSRTLVHYIL